MSRFSSRAPGAAGGSLRVPGTLAALELDGVSVVRGATEYLLANGSAAEYHPVPGEPGFLLVGAHTEFGDVMHEAKHAEQDRRAGFPGSYSERERAIMEIEAYEYELEHADMWGYTRDEVKRLAELRDRYTTLLGELERRG